MAASGGAPARDGRRTLGDAGEDLACAHLAALGYEILDRNWRCPVGELDVVARREESLVFCEVKTRRSHRFGAPVEAVTPTKLRRLRRLASLWLQEHDTWSPTLRIDVVGVLWPVGRDPEVHHLEGVG